MAKAEKRARPDAATSRRAGQEKQRTSSNSRNKHITQAPGGQWGIADLLLPGRENAIPRRELERLTGLDGRTVRLMIERERREGRPILADNATGYYLPATEHERAACVRSMRHRADEIRKTAEAIDRAGV
ncbi:hypothetical protein [Flavonifractor plautii]|uniref:Uncharacterized protein n=1 Tax=Flavonifractor plautii ATCC 29863 TaxID=411475 RepID=G9YX15_FLAPL|nr:hypothetical protein [Flavonifractor plautii]EHM37987.1 hypothetical protein HMPREF0372_04083 [Flavonifractor plautii ATCC 29863]